MSEPLRTASADPGPSSEADREALIERLLLAGLDHYFAGKYEQAVNIWTRVAFLERGHGRARAYIERARGALAERQRESEELLQTGVAAYQAGDLPAARELLNRAVAEGGANETALVFLQRLGRLDAAHLHTGTPDGTWAWPGVTPPRRDVPARTAAGSSSRRADRPEGRTSWLMTIVASVAVFAAILLAAQPIASRLSELPIEAPAAGAEGLEPLPVVRASEARLSRARELYANGRLRDALRLLDDVDLADPLRTDADRLKADVQRDLLATAPPAPPAATERGP
jgi:tetratricopeptide (TPR) repeat protein